MKRLHIIGLLLGLTFSLQSQERQYLFTNLDIKQGLSQNHVQCFLRDNKGFVWIGTTEGLCRFDGYAFKVYKNNPKDTTSIIDNNITKIFQNHDGKLWLSSGDYFEIFDPETEIFTHCRSLFNKRISVPLRSQWGAFFDQKDDIIFRNDLTGIYKYIVKSDSVFQINFPPLSKTRTILDAAIDNYGFIWVVCKEAMLYKLHKDNYSILDSFKLEGKTDNYYTLFIDNQNDIWLFDKNNAKGVYLLNGISGKILHFDTHSGKGRLNNNAITSIIQNTDGNIWIATDHGGINILDKSDLSVQYLLNNPFNERSLCDNTITSIYRDNQDFVWIGSFKKGLGYYHEKLFNFSLFKLNFEYSKGAAFNDIDNFVEDKKGNLWIGTNGGGLIYFDRKKNTFRQYVNDPQDPNSLSENVIIGMYVDKDDRLWAGTYFGGINVFDGHTFKKIRNVPNDPTSLSDDRVWDICEANDGKFWIATLLGGVNVINPKTLKVEKIYRGFAENSIKSEMVFTIIEDRSKLLWFATVNGIRSYDAKTGKFEYYSHDDADPTSISKNKVYDIFEDSRNLLWVATSDGLNLLDRNSKKFRIFKKEDGLPSNYIVTITEDNNHNLWFSTSNGVSNLIVTKDNKSNYIFSFKNYDILDGLQGNEFNEKAAFKTRKGELLFGGSNGFNLFNPNDIVVQNLNSEIVFTDFQVYNKLVTTRDIVNNKKILSKAITYSSSIDLSYKENVFTIEFSSLNFFHPERHKFKYILENFSSEWLLTDGYNRKATYTNLDPGTYTFRVKVTNTDGTWNDNEAKLILHISPPWWETTLFRIFVLLVVLSISIAMYYNRFRRLEKSKLELEERVKTRTNQLSEANALLEERQEEISIQNEELAKHRYRLEMLVEERTAELEKAKVKAEESDKLKSAFLANMSHEIRTPMNAIVGFSSMLDEDNLTGNERKEFIEIINKNCDLLLVLINDILDLSKIEANQVVIFKSAFHVNKILSELENYYKLNKKSQVPVNFVNRGDETNIVLYNDSARFRQIFSNLLDNAFKYTEKGSVKFGYKLLATDIEFYVSDTGIGIRENEIDKLFNYFTKVESGTSKLYRGTGLGLAISKRIVELMGGKIKLETEYGKGTTFRFTLPYNPGVYPAATEPLILSSKKIYSINNLTILVAEDEEANFNFIKAALRSFNISIVWKQNGLEALEFVQQLKSYENLLILMDIKMPVMNGIESLREIRKIDQHIPVIAVTAYALESEKYEILNNSFDDYLVKPLRPDTLFESIERIVRGDR